MRAYKPLTTILPACTLDGEAELLSIILSDLRDHTLKLKYADWLKKRGDPRGLFLRRFVAAIERGTNSRLPKSKSFPEVWRNAVGVTLFQSIREFNFTDRQDILLKLAKPTITITTDLEKRRKFPVGASRFGGLPDLPSDVAWPTWEKGLLGFLGQINLEDLRPFIAAHDLPSRGLLSFFIFNDSEWGMPAPKPDAWRVIFSPDVSALVRHQPNKQLAEWNELRTPCRLTFSETLDLPDSDSPCGKKARIRLDRWKEYAELRESLRRGPSFNYADPPSFNYVDPENGSTLDPWDPSFSLEAHSLETLLWMADVVDSQPKRRKLHRLLGHERISTLAIDPIPGPDWRHFATFSSDDNLKWCWDDEDYLYCFIKDKDLQKAQFQNTFLAHG